jgi:hypothetical protein
MKDKMLVHGIGKQDSILLNPALGLTDTAGGAEPGFTHVRDFLFRPTRRALIQMEPGFLSPAAEHFVNVFADSRADLSRMGGDKSGT